MKTAAIVVIALSMILSTQALAYLDDGCPKGTWMNACGSCINPVELVYHECTPSIIRKMRDRLEKAEQILKDHGLSIDEPLVRIPLEDGKSLWIKPHSMNSVFAIPPQNGNDTTHIVSPTEMNATIIGKPCPDGKRLRTWANNTASGTFCSE